jgi:pimeloyl-ACP methyl ester carboxylesterase
LRRAVGDERLTYLGFSYGTYIGERYAELFPTHIRAMVLDGVVDPTADLDTLLLGQAEALQTQVDDLFDSCAKRASCPVDDPAAAYDQLAARLETEPLGQGVHRFGPTALAFAAVSASYDAGGGDAFLAGLADALDGDPSTLQAIAASYFASGAYSSYLAVLCTDTPHPVGSDEYTALAERLEQASPRFGAAIANEVRPCAHWKAPPVEPTDPVHAKGSPTILVVGNTGDVATPFDDAKTVATNLENGVLLTYRGSGHTSYTKSACVDEVVNRYLVSLTVPDPDTICD